MKATTVDNQNFTLTEEVARQTAKALLGVIDQLPAASPARRPLVEAVLAVRHQFASAFPNELRDL